MIFPIGAAAAELNNATVIHPLVNERTTKLMSYKLRQLRIVRGLRTKFSGDTSVCDKSNLKTSL